MFGGITIREALHNQLGRLADFEKLAFQSTGIEVGQKMSIRWQDMWPIVVKDVNRFLEKERQAGNPVRYNCRELTASNVVLLGVQQVSQGSLQPELGICIVSTAS